ncbi:hypothetical protein KP509_25G068800 [Ceratopteris richardii]|uniref:Uncharacterized protein n=1 Tax=Ceratopteris richardii TaxID=49495 RepID=A0A8T2RTA8_CERRI|nr:hypothetical protein KP509_25G068800 [Ceratopteris richardii]
MKKGHLLRKISLKMALMTPLGSYTLTQWHIHIGVIGQQPVQKIMVGGLTTFWHQKHCQM